MTDQAKATTRAKVADIGSRLAALHPDETAETARPARAPRAPRASTPRPRHPVTSGQAEPMPAQQDRTKTWPERIPLTVDRDMKRALEMARLDDGMEATTRIRAMIVLWQENDRFRSQVDRLARTDTRVQGSRRVRPR
jgi:hypothetical protein